MFVDGWLPIVSSYTKPPPSDALWEKQLQHAVDEARNPEAKEALRAIWNWLRKSQLRNCVKPSSKLLV